MQPGTRNRRSAPVAIGEMNAVFWDSVGDSTAFGARDASVISLLFDMGLRAEDIVALELEDYDSATGELMFRDQLSKAIRRLPLTATARASLNAWLVFRGSSPGPLINPIGRPNRVIVRSLKRGSVNVILLRRAKAAGIDSFTSDEVARTRSLLSGGQWHGPWHALLGRYPAGPRQILSLPNVGRGSSASQVRDPNSQAVIRFVSHHSGLRRSGLLEKLDLWAQLMSDGRHNAWTFDWCQLRADNLPSSGLLLRRFGLRRANRMINALLGLLNEGQLLGLIDWRVYEAIRQHRWWEARPLFRGGPRLEVSDVDRLIDLCLSDPSAAGFRDAVLVGMLWEKAVTISQAICFPWVDGGSNLVCIHSGGRLSSACIHPRFTAALKDWTRFRPGACRELLLTTNKRGAVLPLPMRSSEVSRVIKKWAARAGMGSVSPEDIRSSSIYNSLAYSAREFSRSNEFV